MSSTVRTITPNSVHPQYQQAREDRALSLAHREGVKAFIRDAQSQEPKWILPEPGENKPTDGDIIFNPFEQRYKRLAYDDVYAECVRSNAAEPFSSNIRHDGWPDVLELRLRGFKGGVDGNGSTLKQFYSPTFETKLFAGTDYARIAMDRDIPLWRHVHPDDLLDWSYQYDNGIFVLLGANISTQDGDGRTVFTLENGKVIERKYEKEKKAQIVTTQSDSIPVPNVKVEDKWVQVGDDVVFKGLSSCPVFAFSTTDTRSFTSPPLFAGAARAQLRAINLRSHLDRFEVDVLRSYLMTVTGWSGAKSHKRASDGELIEQEKLPVSGRAIAIPDKEAKIGSYQVNPESIEKVRKDIENAEASIRRQCLDSQRLRDGGGDVKAAEVKLQNKRKQTVISVQVSYDMATLTAMAKATVDLMGSTYEEGAMITMEQSFFDHPDHAVVDKVAEYAEKNLVDQTFFLDVAQDNLTSIDARHWEELKKRIERRGLVDSSQDSDSDD